MTDRGVSAIVLAAGYGKRMKSEIRKVLHRAAGRSLLGHVLAATQPLGLQATVIVTPPESGEIEPADIDEGSGPALPGNLKRMRKRLAALAQPDQSIRRRQLDMFASGLTRTCSRQKVAPASFFLFRMIIRAGQTARVRKSGVPLTN